MVLCIINFTVIPERLISITNFNSSDMTVLNQMSSRFKYSSSLIRIYKKANENETQRTARRPESLQVLWQPVPITGQVST